MKLFPDETVLRPWVFFPRRYFIKNTKHKDNKDS